MEKKEKIVAIILLVALGIVYRFLPHPPNFVPIAAISLFSGFFFRRYFFAVPIAMMFFSDIFVGFYDWKIMAAVYICFGLTSFLGLYIRKNKTIVSVIGCSIAAATGFFIFTNLAVWAFSGWYVHDIKGLTECYTLALPFFRNTLLGDLFYTAAIFGLYEIAAQPAQKLAFAFSKKDN